MIRKFWQYTAMFATVATVSLSPSAAIADDFLRDLFNHNSDYVQLTATNELLFMSREVNSAGNVVNGPDAGRLDFDNTDFNYETGYRLSLGVETPQNRIEAIFSQYGTWYSRETGSMTAGISFDGSIPASWPAGSNTLGPTTFFTPLRTASTASLGGEGDEADGLGPNSGFADAPPTFSRSYESELRDLQINWIDNDPTADIRFGLGFRNVQLDETAGLQISGAFRATDIGVANGGLSHATLTGVGGLTFTTGVPDGFEDESILGNNGPTDQLTMFYSARTSNDLNGFQAIFDACLIENERFELTLIGRAGAYHNHTSGRVQERYDGLGAGSGRSTYERSFNDTKDSVAFVGGVSAQGAVRLNDYFRLIAGYQGTFIAGVALSPEQAAGVRGEVYKVDTDGNVIVHGANVGIEFTY